MYGYVYGGSDLSPRLVPFFDEILHTMRLVLQTQQATYNSMSYVDEHDCDVLAIDLNRPEFAGDSIT